MGYAAVEDNQITGVQQMDGNGNIQLRYFTFYPWDGRSAAAMDDQNYFLGIFNGDKKTVEIAVYKVGEPRGKILTVLPVQPWPEETDKRWRGRLTAGLDGLAVTKTALFATVANNNALSNKKHRKTVDKIVALPLAVDATAKFNFTPSAKPRAFDLRIYSVMPGKLDAFRARWRDHAVPIHERHGLHSVGWWVAEKKDADGHEQFVVLLAGDSVESIQKSIAAFHADPEWQRIEKETEKDGKFRGGVEAFKMTPADFSSLK